MKNSIEHIWHFFHSLDSLNYPRHLIQLGILVSDSKDRTYERALELADERQYSRKKKEQYGRISVFRKDFVDEEKFIATKADAEVPALAVKDLEKGSDEMSNVGKARHSFSFQKYRRSLLARSRSWLLLSALAPEVDYVLWMDVDVVQYENDLLQTLIGWSEKENADVVAPNCMWKSYNEMG
jgi:mannan polymerase complexes MNN9 subunit